MDGDNDIHGDYKLTKKAAVLTATKKGNQLKRNANSLKKTKIECIYYVIYIYM